MHGRFPLPDVHIGVHDLAIETQGFLREQGIEVGPREKLLGELPPRQIVHLGLPVVLQAEHKPSPVSFAGSQPRQTRICQVGQQTVSPPGRINLQMPTVMLPRGAEMVAHRRSTTDREHFMHLERRVVPRPGKLLAQGVTYRNRRRIDDIPVGHATQRARQIHLLRPGVGQRTVGKHLHALFQGLIEPPIEGGTRHMGHLTLQIGAQDVRLISPTRRPGRDHHRPHEHPQVQFALSLHHAELLAEAVDLLLWQDRLEDLPHLITGHGLALHAIPSFRMRSLLLRRASRARNSPRVKLHKSPFPQALGLSGHVWNKGENANQFSKAISFGNNHDFLSGEKIEQEIAEGCQRLIKNAIICWNYLYLSQKIGQAQDVEHRQALLAAVQHGSVVSWHHVNLHGEYDFSDEKMQDSVGLQLPPELVVSLSSGMEPEHAVPSSSLYETLRTFVWFT